MTPASHSRAALTFIVESGTDVRLVEGLAEHFRTRLLLRRVMHGREISQPTAASVDMLVGPASFARFAWFVLRRLLADSVGAGAVIVQGYGAAALGANLAGWLTGRAVAMLVCSPTEAYYACRRDDSISGRRFRYTEWIALHLLARINARLGQRYFVLSPYLAQVVRQHGTRRPVEIVPVYGVNASVFTPAREPKAAIRSRLGLPDSAEIVFFSSRIAPEKDPDTLLEAVRLLRREGRDVRILHRSGGHQEFAARAALMGLSEAVIAGDAVAPDETLADLYRASNVCVQASRAEGLGFSVLESLACGVPVVAAAVGGLRDTVGDGETGWTYPPGNAAALASAIRAVLADPAEAERRTLRGRERVQQDYERERTFRLLRDAVGRMVGRSVTSRTVADPVNGAPRTM